MKNETDSVSCLPDGAIFLGRGGAFARPQFQPTILGWAIDLEDDEDVWTFGEWYMSSGDFFYAAPVGSEVARLNTAKSLCNSGRK